MTITKDNASKFPGIALYQDDVAKGRLLAYHITKLSDAQRPLEPMILRRNGWLFEPVEMPTSKERDDAIQNARREQARQKLETLLTYLRERPCFKPSRQNLEDVRSDIGLSRDELRAAITQGMMQGTLVETDLPPDECRGARKTYLSVFTGGR